MTLIEYITHLYNIIKKNIYIKYSVRIRIGFFFFLYRNRIIIMLYLARNSLSEKIIVCEYINNIYKIAELFEFINKQILYDQRFFNKSSNWRIDSKFFLFWIVNVFFFLENLSVLSNMFHFKLFSRYSEYSILEKLVVIRKLFVFNEGRGEILLSHKIDRIFFLNPKTY